MVAIDTDIVPFLYKSDTRAAHIGRGDILFLLAHEESVTAAGVFSLFSSPLQPLFHLTPHLRQP